MLRLLSFTVFLATWWGAALLAGGEKLPPPPAVLAAIIAEANSGALFFNLGVTLARVALAFTLAMTLGAAIGYAMGRSTRRSLADPTAQSAGARRHRACVYLGRINGGRRDCGGRH
jgi:ABC-type nitrate/sulfonate/bicarbonate transport system permease component